MYWYKRNIGDYHKKAGRLTMLQHGAYTLLMDACYDREKFPTRDEAIEWIWASSDEEIHAVDFVLARFFVLDEGVYVQHRIVEELESYNIKAEKNRQIALEREAKRRESAIKKHVSCSNGEPIVNEAPPNQEPRTSNQEPRTSNQDLKKEKTVSQKLDFSSWPAMPNEQLLKDWKLLRSRLKANVTQTVVDRTSKELHKAVQMGFTVDQCFEQWIFKGWRGFEADWMRSNAYSQQSTQQPAVKKPRMFGQ